MKTGSTKKTAESEIAEKTAPGSESLQDALKTDSPPAESSADLQPGVPEGTQRNFTGEHLNYDPLRRVAPLMTDAEYIKNRLDNQIAWYDRKSQVNQKEYKKYKKIEFIIAATIPVITTFSAVFQNSNEDPASPVSWSTLAIVLTVGAAIGGIVLVVINKMLELGDYFRLWKEYRTSCEALQYERNLYLTRSEPYDESDAFPLLVSRVENILSREIQKWQQRKKPVEAAPKKDNSKLSAPL